VQLTHLKDGSVVQLSNLARSDPQMLDKVINLVSGALLCQWYYHCLVDNGSCEDLTPSNAFSLLKHCASATVCVQLGG
jgi:hypothetical protein